ncbi:MAG: ATP-binding protein [Pseudomonadota bacterium]
MSSNAETSLGTVQDVSGVSISVTMNSKRLSGLTFVHGHAHRIGQLGSFVKIPIGYIDLFGIVSQVGASAIPDSLKDEDTTSHRWLTVQLIGEGSRQGKFQRGISQYPTIDDEVHLVTEADLAKIYGKKGEQNHLVKIGHIAGSESIDALVDVNRLVTRHSAIVGTTGSGKSTTVAGLLNALSEPESFPSSRIVVVDIHGEYGKALKEKANVFKINPDKRNSWERGLFLPYWAMSFDEFLAVTFGNLPSNARNVILEKVIEYKALALDSHPIPGITKETVSADSPVPFSLHQLWYDLYCHEFGTYYSDDGKLPEQDNWAFELDADENEKRGDPSKGIPPRFKKNKNVKGDDEKITKLPNQLNIHGPLENLGARLRVARYDFLLNPGDWKPNTVGKVEADLPALLQSWIGSGKPISVLDLSGVPTSILNDVVGIFLRVLYDAMFWARNLSQGARERPLLVVMEEAHLYLNDELQGLASSIVKRIVKEGRKYGIGAMIVSQRPSEINSTILSQCGTFFALRLSNSSDRSHITGALSDNLEGLTNMLPVLRTGEAIVLGEAVSLPMRTLISAPPEEARPDSQDPLVCDVLPPELSRNPGGWGVNGHSDLERAFDDVSQVWRRQNPILPAPKKKED